MDAGAGVQRNVILLIETGENQPTIGTVVKLAGALGMNASQLLAEAEQATRSLRPSGPDQWQTPHDIRSNLRQDLASIRQCPENQVTIGSAKTSSTRMTSRGISFSDLLLVNAIRDLEAEGPLEDSREIRAAAESAGSRQQQIIERARLLANRIGLLDDLQRMTRWTPLPLFAAAVCVVALTYVLLAAIVGDGRTINAIVALISILGAHALSVLAWLLALVLPRSTALGGWLGSATGRLAAFFGAHWPSLGGHNGPALQKAGLRTLNESGLAPWGLGLASHTIWALSFLLVLPMLFFAFSFTSYRLVWETTILSREFFADFVRVTGHLPSLLGFPMPDANGIGSAAGDGADHRLWALWLMGCTVTYGLLLRVVLALVCLITWHLRSRSLAFDMSEPYFRKLSSRLDVSVSSRVIDAESPPAKSQDTPSDIQPTPAGGALLLGFELPPETEWPPQGLDSAAVMLTKRILGSNEERNAILELVARDELGKILMVCNGASSPDRGTERFLRDLTSRGRLAALLLVAPNAHSVVDSVRWHEWAAKIGLPGLSILASSLEANAWKARVHG